MAIPPLKHVLDDLLVIPAGNTSTQIVTLAKGTINPNYYTNNNNVRNGSKIFSMNIEIEFGPSTANDASGTLFYDWYVWFNINGAQTQPTPNNVGATPLQSQVFHQDGGMFLMQTSGNTNIPQKDVVRLQLSIPRAWQQLNDNDTIELVCAKSSQTTNQLIAKIKVIYKEIFP